MTKKSGPWLPAKYDDTITSAVKALNAGVASAGQQQTALKWIIETVCGTYDMSYRPESDRDTVFAEGKRFVGNQLVKQLRLTTSEKRSA